MTTSKKTIISTNPDKQLSAQSKPSQDTPTNLQRKKNSFKVTVAMGRSRSLLLVASSSMCTTLAEPKAPQVRTGKPMNMGKPLVKHSEVFSDWWLINYMTICFPMEQQYNIFPQLWTPRFSPAKSVRLVGCGIC